MEFVTEGAIVLTIITSLLSGLVGVFVSSCFYARLERRRIKMETAKKMFGNRHAISGNSFQEAMNEVLIVFSDSVEVINAIQEFMKVVETPPAAQSHGAADEALIKLMKAICKNIGVRYKNLPDSYYLKFFGVPQIIESNKSTQFNSK